MNAEQITASIEPSKRLDELGVKIDSYFQHTRWAGYSPDGSDGKNQITHGTPPRGYELACEFIAPAPTVAELGEVLNLVEGALIQDALSTLIPHIGLLAHNVVKDALITMLRNPDLCARVLIWLLENHHITAEEINGGEL
jgi:hypothetical protein